LKALSFVLVPQRKTTKHKEAGTKNKAQSTKLEEQSTQRLEFEIIKEI